MGLGLFQMIVVGWGWSGGGSGSGALSRWSVVVKGMGSLGLSIAR